MTTTALLLAFIAGLNGGFVLHAFVARRAGLIGPLTVAAATIGLSVSLALVNR